MKISPLHYYRLWREPWRKVFWTAYYKYRADKMEARRMDLSFLQSGDTVLDFGGFEGAWAEHAYAHNHPEIHIFEPHPVFAADIEKRFAGREKVHCHTMALGSADGILELSDDGDASSSHVSAGSAVSGKIRKAGDFLSQIEPPVALAKINIEGGEYDLLPALEQAGWLQHIKVLQIQFHLYSEADIARRDEIRRSLAQTHDCDWDYPFVWEQWTLR